MFLLKAECITAEHLGLQELALDDLICLTPAGHVHLDLLGNLDYLAACSEDTAINDLSLAKTISERVASKFHLTLKTAASNAVEFIEHVERVSRSSMPTPSEKILTSQALNKSELLQESVRAAKNERTRVENCPWLSLPDEIVPGFEIVGRVAGIGKHGVFVKIANVVGLIPSTFLYSGGVPQTSWPRKDESVKVRVRHLDQVAQRLILDYVALVRTESAATPASKI